MGDLISNSISDPSFESQLFGQKSNLFVGFSPKSLELDSVKSPTSPLDFWVFTNLANPFVRSPKSSLMKWCNSKVGLSIIESLDEIKPSDSPKVVTKTPFVHGSIDTFNAPKSLPKNCGVFNRTQIKLSSPQKGSSDIVFGIGENPFKAESFENFQSSSLDSGRSWLTNFSIDSSFESLGSKTRMNPFGSNPDPVGSTRDFIGSLSASEIELSEDYTCVKTFGPNPKTTHIFGDYVLECHNKIVTNLSDDIEEQKIQFEACIPFPSDYFLSLCFSCKKNLDGKDVYIYRGEKAFCSPECRLQEISIEEREEKALDVSHKSSSKTNSEEIGALFFIA